MKNKIEPIIVIVVLSVFILIMNAGGVLKKPFAQDDDFLGTLTQYEQSIQSENWEEADIQLHELETAWSKIQSRIQFSVEKGRLYELESSMATLHGTNAAQDKKLTIIEIEKLKDFFDHLHE